MRNIEVIINGRRFVEAPLVCENPELLDFQYNFPDAGGVMRIRDYLRVLLTTLWWKGDRFDSRRPFGNGGWEYDLISALVAAKAVKGVLNESGQVDTSTLGDRNEIDRIVGQLISEMCAAKE